MQLRGVGSGRWISGRGLTGALSARRFRGRLSSGYTAGMDPVRLGRVLGMGARHAAKTLVTAVDAATTENPSAKAAPAGARPASKPATARAVDSNSLVRAATMQTAARAVARTTTQARETQRGLERGGRRFREAAWRPFVRLSGVLWLEVTGVFFGVFALIALQGVWKWRAEWHANPGGHTHLAGAVAMAVVFVYFCVSSFVRAHRRSRRR
jgi:hypothetical protein